MPVARIIAANRDDVEPLVAELRRAGYRVEFAAPGDEGGDADLVITAETEDAAEALRHATRLALEMNADVIVAPGVAPSQTVSQPAPAASGAEPVAELSDAEPAAPSDVAASGALSETIHDINAALQDGREGIRESLEQYRERVSGTFAEIRERRELVAEARRLERERKELEREERRRQKELLEGQRLEAEAREREERDRLRREAEAERDRLRREEEAQRQAEVEAERARLAAEAQSIRAERERIAREHEAALARMARHRATSAVTSAPAMSPTPTPARLAGIPRSPVMVRPHARSVRRKRMQQATFAASVVALLLMLGLAVALNMRPESPVPNNLVQSPVEQQVPFGPAHVNAKPAAPVHAPAPQATRKPSPVAPHASQRPRAHVRRSSREAEVVADDEVVVHQYRPARQQTAQSRGSDGVRRISDQ